MYLIPNSEIADDYRRVMEDCHGKLINADDDVSQALRLSNMLSESSPTDDDDARTRSEHGIFAKHKVDKSEPIRDSAITHVYLSGWML